MATVSRPAFFLFFFLLFRLLLPLHCALSFQTRLLPRQPASSARRRFFPGLLPALASLPIILTTPALADCECGYLSTIDDDGDYSGSHHQNSALFTDLLETDFTRPLHPLDPVSGGEDDNDNDHNPDDNNDSDGDGDGDSVVASDADWAPQAFNLSRERARGEYGEMFGVENVRVSPDRGHSDHGNQQEAEANGEGKGEESRRARKTTLELIVRGQLVDGMVPVAELDTRRQDLFWGTFRASMRVPRVSGTCAAFFWYFNDTQEIDMEFLNKDFNATNGSYPVSLVLQSREAALAGYDAAKTGNFVRAYLPFDPSAGFHEYRIDYLPGRVVFYADGRRLAAMDGPAVPSSAGHLILQHWSNGNPLWSGGPPAGADAALAVRYVKAYFNSSDPARRRDWQRRCRDPRADGAVCRIPDVTPSDSGAAGWFFKDHGNMTNNQSVSGQSTGSRTAEGPPAWWSTLGWLAVVGGLAVVFT